MRRIHVGPCDVIRADPWPMRRIHPYDVIRADQWLMRMGEIPVVIHHVLWG